MGEVSTIGLDLAKSVFQAHGADASGAVVFRKKLRRHQVLAFFCGAAALHGGDGGLRRRASLGARDRPARARGAADPAGLREAVRQAAEERCGRRARRSARRPSARRCASWRSRASEAQAAAVVFRARDLLVRQRTQIINALRGHLAEFGLVVAKGPAQSRTSAGCRGRGRAGAGARPADPPVLIEMLHALDEQIALLDREIAQRAKEDETARRLMTIPGVGPITATALAALAPPAETFRRGRDFAAWLGLTPLQQSTGGKQKLGQISKMGERTCAAC